MARPQHHRTASAETGETRAQDAVATAPDVIVRIRSLLPSLAPAEQRVGMVITGDPQRAARLTISELAREAETSQATVIRFCRSIDVGSYPDLRIAVATWAGRAGANGVLPLSLDIQADDGLAELVAKIAASDATAVRDTAAALDLDQLRQAVDAVVEAGRVDIYGVAASGLVAQDLQQKLHRIGLLAFAWTDPHLAITSGANLRAGDVAIGISHTGTTQDTIDALAQARSVGARTIAVTNFANSPIAPAADLLLCTSAQETTFRAGAMGSRIAALTVVDCLFVGVAQRNHSSALAALARTHDALQARHRPSRLGVPGDSCDSYDSMSRAMASRGTPSASSSAVRDVSASAPDSSDIRATRTSPPDSASAAAHAASVAPDAWLSSRTCRARSFALTGVSRIIRFENVRPSRIMSAVENELSRSFCAVPALRRVEPVIASGPVSAQTTTSA
jgi:DNA-binding MurR/RpiR family transcriptional regulator